MVRKKWYIDEKPSFFNVDTLKRKINFKIALEKKNSLKIFSLFFNQEEYFKQAYLSFQKS